MKREKVEGEIKAIGQEPDDSTCFKEDNGNAQTSGFTISFPMPIPNWISVLRTRSTFN